MDSFVTNLPHVALWFAALCTVALVVLSVRQGASLKSKTGVSWAGLFLGAAGAVSVLQLEFLGPWKMPIVGLLGGFAAAMALLDFSDSDDPAALGAPIGLCAVMIGVWAAEAKGQPLLALGILTGVGAAAGVLASIQRGRAAVVFVAVGVAAMAAFVLGGSVTDTEGVQTTVNVLTIALIALMLGEGLRAATKKSKLGWPNIGTALGFGAMAYFVTSNTSSFPDLPLVVAGTVLVAVLLTLATRGDAAGSFGSLVSAAVWLGVASAAFSFGKGYGMALAGLVAVTASLLAGERRAVALVSPILALSLYRLARFLFPDFSRSFDIGQHYAIVGLIVGILLPLILLEWGRDVSDGKTWPTTLATAFAGVGALVATSFAVAFLGAKGASGLVIGYGLSPAVSTLKGAVPKTALATGLALACWTVTSIGAMASEEELARPDKTRLLGIVALVVVGLAVVAWLLTRFKKGTEE